MYANFSVDTVPLLVLASYQSCCEESKHFEDL